MDADGFADADTEVDADCEGVGLPFTAGIVVGCAVTVPNVLGASDLIGGTDAGEEERGAEASSIEPKVTEPAKIDKVSKASPRSDTVAGSRGCHE